jgi:hypothetical protein
MPGKLVAEIVTLRSLQTLVEQIEVDIATYSLQKEDYSERLGSFLRDAEEKYGDEDWFKEFSLENITGDKPKKDDSKKKSNKKKKKKKKKKGDSDSWVPFKSLELTSSVQGEAEIMFETLQVITEKLEALEESKESIDELRNVGLGNEVVYVCYVKDGVISKIVLKSVNVDEISKFTFNMGFSKSHILEA